MSTWGKNNPDQSPKKNWSAAEAKGKLETYCAYQERCAWEVRRKLYEKGIQGKPADDLIEEMFRDGFFVVTISCFSTAFAVIIHVLMVFCCDVALLFIG